MNDREFRQSLRAFRYFEKRIRYVLYRFRPSDMSDTEKAAAKEMFSALHDMEEHFKTVTQARRAKIVWDECYG